MALIIRGKSTCALCGEVLEDGDDLFATTAFIENRDHPLWRFSDAAMHHACFLGWSDREVFVGEFNSFYRRHYRGTRFMHSDGRIEEREPRSRGPA